MIIDWENENRTYMLYDMETFSPSDPISTEDPEKIFFDSEIQTVVFAESRI